MLWSGQTKSKRHSGICGLLFRSHCVLCRNVVAVAAAVIVVVAIAVVVVVVVVVIWLLLML